MMWMRLIKEGGEMVVVGVLAGVGTMEENGRHWMSVWRDAEEMPGMRRGNVVRGLIKIMSEKSEMPHV